MPSTGDLCLSTLHNTEGNALPSRGKRQHQVQPRARAAPSAAARAAPSADTKERAPPARRRPCQAEASYLNSHTKRTASADAGPCWFMQTQTPAWDMRPSRNNESRRCARPSRSSNKQWLMVGWWIRQKRQADARNETKRQHNTTVRFRESKIRGREDICQALDARPRQTQVEHDDHG